MPPAWGCWGRWGGWGICSDPGPSGKMVAMPRAIWSGTISFGLVSIPVKLFTAVSRKSVHFNQIDTRTNSRIKQRRVSEADGSEVPPEALAKGYQLASGE